MMVLIARRLKRQDAGGIANGREKTIFNSETIQRHYPKTRRQTGGITSRSESITHNVASPDEIKKQIMLLMTSLASDGIEIEPLEKEDKEKLN